MKPIKIISIVYICLYILWLPFIGYLSWDAVNSGMDRPQNEEWMGAWDYFLWWSVGALVTIIILWALTVGIYSIICALRHRRRAFVNRA